MDFQSKLRTEIGSYFITGLMKGIRDNNDKKCWRVQSYLDDIFDTIQQDLHARGKQLPEAKYNNPMTKKIVFVEQDNDDNDEEPMRQMMEMHERRLSDGAHSNHSDSLDSELRAKAAVILQNEDDKFDNDDNIDIELVKASSIAYQLSNKL